MPKYPAIPTEAMPNRARLEGSGAAVIAGASSMFGPNTPGLNEGWMKNGGATVLAPPPSIGSTNCICDVVIVAFVTK
jgi:hypothetical protein